MLDLRLFSKIKTARFNQIPGFDFSKLLFCKVLRKTLTTSQWLNLRNLFYYRT